MNIIYIVYKCFIHYLDLLTSIFNPHGFEDPMIIDDVLEEENDSEEDISMDEFREIIAQLEFNKTLRKRLLSKDAESLLKKKIYNKMAWKFNTTCSIMLTDFKENQEIIQLPCNHCFIPEGIIKWLETKKADCPLCRKPVMEIK